MEYKTIDGLRSWNKSSDRHTKLQYVYAVAAIVVLLVAGLIGFINYSLGQTLLSIAAGLAVIFFVNAVAWALVDAFLLSHLAPKRSSNRKS